MSYEEAIKYIQNLLDNGTSWKEHHHVLTEALTVIMKHITDGGVESELTEHTKRDTRT